MPSPAAAGGIVQRRLAPAARIGMNHVVEAHSRGRLGRGLGPGQTEGVISRSRFLVADKHHGLVSITACGRLAELHVAALRLLLHFELEAFEIVVRQRRSARRTSVTRVGSGDIMHVHAVAPERYFDSFIHRQTNLASFFAAGQLGVIRRLGAEVDIGQGRQGEQEDEAAEHHAFASVLRLRLKGK